MRSIAIAAAALVLAGACSTEPTGLSGEEMVLAQQSEVIARDVVTTTETRHEDWVRRLFAALRDSDDPEAQACLAAARELRQQARAAFEAGDRPLARQLLHQSFLQVLCAVVEVFPNAPARTGEVVDDVVSRIETRLGDREAPRIRAILAHVAGLRERAEAALAAGEPVEALALNLRSIQILHRLVSHVRDAHRDHDAIADQEMADIGI